MSTIKRRKRISQRELGPYKRHELLFGEIVYTSRDYYSGYGDFGSTDLSDFISDAMRADWETNREELLAFWQSGEFTTTKIFPDSKPFLYDCGDPDTLPWAAKVFDQPDDGPTPPDAA